MFAPAALLERFCAVFGTCSVGVTSLIPATLKFLAQKFHGRIPRTVHESVTSASGKACDAWWALDGFILKITH